MKGLRKVVYLPYKIINLCSMNKVGLGTRVINFVVDTLIIFIISYISYHIRSFYVFYYHITDIPFYYFFWAIMVVYYFLFETLFKRTPGKWLSISKVVNINGGKPAVWQIAVRSLCRVLPVDCFFLPFIEMTLHDYVSRTIVVEA